MTSFVGKGNEANEFEESEFIDEKAAEVTNTYKRGDLLKMHTYNDAIRRTIGSYILYPGEAATSESGGKVFSLYDEILPGVGAFAIKPSISAQGENELRNFITSLIAEKSKGNSRLNRLKYYADMVLQEPAAFKESSTEVADNLSKSLCVLGYIKAEKPEDYYFSLVKNNLLKPGKEFLFYYYAIKDGTVYSHHRDIAKAFFFRFYKNNINENDTYELEPILCEIVSNELISKQDLVRRLVNQGYETTIDEHHADFYFVMKIKVESNSMQKELRQMSDVDGQNGNNSFSPHSPKIINI